jgi:hypothetical protein
MTLSGMYETPFGVVGIEAASAFCFELNSRSRAPIITGGSRRVTMKANSVSSGSQIFSQLKSPNSIKIGDFTKKTIAICALES